MTPSCFRRFSGTTFCPPAASQQRAADGQGAPPQGAGREMTLAAPPHPSSDPIYRPQHLLLY
jgi:hypothetical protein